MSLKEYLKKEEVFNPETLLEKIPEYQLMNIVSFLTRSENMIIEMFFEGDKFRIISEEEFSIAREDTECSLKEDEYNNNRELPTLYLERCENDFTLVDE